MNRIWSHELADHAGQHITLSGWLHRFRQQRHVSFLVLRDAKGLAQIVLDDAETIATVASLHHESVLSVSGIVVAQPQAPGGYELHTPAITVLSPAQAPMPFDLFRPELNAQLPTQLDHAVLALRHPLHRARFTLAAALTAGFRTTLTNHHFTEIQTPKIVAGATESGANVFAIDYFGKSAFLAQSPQLYKQVMVGVFERVFEIGPVFRAEPHDTPRHLNEYISLDAEMGFITDHHDVMRQLSDTLRGMLESLPDPLIDQLRGFGMTMPVIPSRIPVVHFTEALDLVSHGLGEDVRAEPDLAPAHERWLGQWALRELGSDFLFVEGYPREKRPFYTHPDPTRPGYTNGFDLLFRGLELVTGGQRLHHHADYLEALCERGMTDEGLRWYLEAFRHGMPPHGGFAIGLERLVARFLQLDNIREARLFPRDLTRLTP